MKYILFDTVKQLFKLCIFFMHPLLIRKKNHTGIITTTTAKQQSLSSVFFIYFLSLFVNQDTLVVPYKMLWFFTKMN